MSIIQLRFVCMCQCCSLTTHAEAAHGRNGRSPVARPEADSLGDWFGDLVHVSSVEGWSRA